MYGPGFASLSAKGLNPVCVFTCGGGGVCKAQSGVSRSKFLLLLGAWVHFLSPDPYPLAGDVILSS